MLAFVETINYLSIHSNNRSVFLIILILTIYINKIVFSHFLITCKWYSPAKKIV